MRGGLSSLLLSAPLFHSIITPRCRWGLWNEQPFEYFFYHANLLVLTPMASSSCTWRAFICIVSISVCFVAFAFSGLLRATGLEAGVGVELLVGWVCERVLHGILWL